MHNSHALTLLSLYAASAAAHPRATTAWDPSTLSQQPGESLASSVAHSQLHSMETENAHSAMTNTPHVVNDPAIATAGPPPHRRSPMPTAAPEYDCPSPISGTSCNEDLKKNIDPMVVGGDFPGGLKLTDMPDYEPPFATGKQEKPAETSLVFGDWPLHRRSPMTTPFPTSNPYSHGWRDRLNELTHTTVVGGDFPGGVKLTDIPDYEPAYPTYKEESPAETSPVFGDGFEKIISAFGPNHPRPGYERVSETPIGEEAVSTSEAFKATNAPIPPMPVEVWPKISTMTSLPLHSSDAEAIRSVFECPDRPPSHSTPSLTPIVVPGSGATLTAIPSPSWENPCMPTYELVKPTSISDDSPIPTSDDSNSPILARDSREPTSRNPDPASNFCHRHPESTYNVQLKTTQEPDELCGGLWDNLKRHPGQCVIGTTHECGEHEKLKNLPTDEHGDQVFVTSWHFSVSDACDEGEVESAIWEATWPHLEGIRCEWQGMNGIRSMSSGSFMVEGW